MSSNIPNKRRLWYILQIMQIDNTLKYIIYTLLGAVLLTPFIIDVSQLFPYITGKAFIFRILALSIFITWLVLAIRNVTYRPRLSLILISVTAFVLMIGVSNVFGQNPFTSFWSNYERMEGYVNILHLFALFIAIGSTLKTRAEWDKFILTSFIMSVGMIFASLQQYFKPGHVEGFRLDSNFGNPIYLAAYSLFHIFFGGYLIASKNFIKENSYKIIIAVVTLLHLFVLYQTITRGALLGLVAGVFIICALNALSLKKENKKIWTGSIISVVTILVLITTFYFVRDSQFVKNTFVLNRFAEISISSGTSEARLLNWTIALEGFKERPIFGWGMGNYSYVFDTYYLPAMYGNEAWFDHVHNIALDWLIAGGIVGLLLYMFIIGSLLWTIWKSPHYSYLEKNIFIGLVAGYTVHNMFVFDNQTSYIYFFFLLAMFHSQHNKEISLFSQKIEKNTVYLLSVVLWITLPVALYFINVPGYFASVKTIDSLRELSTLQQVPAAQAPLVVKGIIERIKKVATYNSFASFEIRTKGIMEPAFALAQLPENYLSQAEKQDYIQFAFKEITNEMDNNPNDAKTAYVLGIYLSNFGDYQNANIFLERAVALSPKKQFLQITLAFNYLNLGQKEKAIEVAKAAYELADGDTEKNPKYDSLWIEYMRIVSLADTVLFDSLIKEEIKDGRAYRVENLFKKMIELSPESTPNYISLATFYFQMGKKQESLDILKVAKTKNPNDQKQLDALILNLEAGKNLQGQKI